MALRDSARPQADRSNRVVLDAYGFIKGWLIATSLWVGALLLVVAVYFGVPAAWNGTDAGHVWGLLGIAIFYSFGVALVFAAPLAWVLAYVLRPVGNQWVHIVAFFFVPTLTFWVLGSVLNFGWQPVMLIPWATVGVAAAIGRWAIRRDALFSSATPPA
ncbi:hypothetical protein CXX84_15560 [Arthrobacter sp. AFG7.2]|uniref:hypothetical protein n=1 Tax=Arthrobacter sp. AFG7.2 TaxID=1688693 RepID=UPI000C9EA1B5|nr:hypothetical protein [Arthrobacter sp. AFG7.2]PNI07732.1 hypothetical protein CXX84_15560 [Arthrobacter sp. AFG7.2]